MTGSSSSRSSGHSRRCPKCRRRMKKMALRCFHCNWEIPYRQAYLALITLCMALVGVAVALIAIKVLSPAAPPSDSVKFTSPKSGGRK